MRHQNKCPQNGLWGMRHTSRDCISMWGVGWPGGTLSGSGSHTSKTPAAPGTLLGKPFSSSLFRKTKNKNTTNLINLGARREREEKIGLHRLQRFLPPWCLVSTPHLMDLTSRLIPAAEVKLRLHLIILFPASISKMEEKSRITADINLRPPQSAHTHTHARMHVYTHEKIK